VSCRNEDSHFLRRRRHSNPRGIGSLFEISAALVDQHINSKHTLMNPSFSVLPSTMAHTNGDSFEQEQEAPYDDDQQEKQLVAAQQQRRTVDDDDDPCGLGRQRQEEEHKDMHINLH
jgi:hypothetical protein